ncbi:MAG: FeoB-associated Cys-rich membrane protein [Halodesulfovibrio sp.]
MGSIVVGLAVLLVAALAVRNVYKTKQKGGCLGGCAGCSGCGHNHHDDS